MSWWREPEESPAWEKEVALRLSSIGTDGFVSDDYLARDGGLDAPVGGWAAAVVAEMRQEVAAGTVITRCVACGETTPRGFRGAGPCSGCGRDPRCHEDGNFPDDCE